MSDKKLEVFNVLNFLNSGYEINDILKEGNFGEFKSSEECINYLIENNYILDKTNLSSKDLSEKYTVNELKELLRENNLKVSGKKQELIERLLPVLSDNSGDYEITDKAKDFLKENEWIDLYMFALVAFKFDDYEFFVENSNDDMINIALKFCDEVISNSLMYNQFIIFIDALSAKAHVYAYIKDYESFLDYDLQRFILGLNPIILDAQTYANYEIINLKNVTEQFDFGSLKKRFDKIWVKSNIKDVTIPKKTSYKILKRAFDGADIKKLNEELKEKYFDKKFGI